MKLKKLISILALCLLLSGCSGDLSEELDSFSVIDCDFSFANEKSVFCIGNDEVFAYSRNGEILERVKHEMAAPMWNTAEKFAVIYDSGGTELIISDGRTIKHNYEDNIIMSTAINENGLFAVCTEEAGYKGSVTVYDSELTPLYKWYCASGDLICAALSRDGTLAVLTENEKGSTVHVFSLDSETELWSLTLEDERARDMVWTEERLCVLTENAVCFPENGRIKKRMSFEKVGEYVLGRTLTVLELCNGDGTSCLVSFDAKGHEQGRLQCEMLRGLAAEGERAAILTGNNALLLDAGMNELLQTDAKGVRSVMLSSGIMLLLRDGTVYQYQ